MAFGLDTVERDDAQLYKSFIEFLIDQYASGKRSILIVDEAQNLKADILEELRMLSNVNNEKDQLLQIILVGQPELRDTLRKPELRQLCSASPCIAISTPCGPSKQPLIFATA